MGLMDKAKGLIEEHRGQVEQGLHKATDKFNKLAGGQASSGTPTATEPETSPADDAPEAEAQQSATATEPEAAAEATGASEESPDAE
jgi:hypothetical protein